MKTGTTGTPALRNVHTNLDFLSSRFFDTSQLHIKDYLLTYLLVYAVDRLWHDVSSVVCLSVRHGCIVANLYEIGPRLL